MVEKRFDMDIQELEKRVSSIETLLEHGAARRSEARRARVRSWIYRIGGRVVTLAIAYIAVAIYYSFTGISVPWMRAVAPVMVVGIFVFAGSLIQYLIVTFVLGERREKLEVEL